MTQPPTLPPTPPSMPPTTEYAPPPPRLSAMALTSMILGILGILGILLAIVLIGVPLAWVGLILGIMSLVQINKRPQELGGKGFAIAGIVTGAIGGACVGPPLLLAILLPSLGKARELSNRSVCAANIRGITQSMNVYAADFSDDYPVMPFKPMSPVNAGTSAATASGSVDDAYKAMYAPSSPVAGSTLAGPWVLVLRGDVSAKSFLCKSDVGNTPAAVSSGTGYFLNFQDGRQISYSFAYPYGDDGKVGKWWKAMIDASLPTMADMNPKDGTGSPRRSVASGTKAANSGNHQSDGQNVGFGDNHVEFTRLPNVGQDSDNIYTGSGTGGVSERGIQPTLTRPPEIQSKAYPIDVIMVPTRDLDTHALW